MIWEASEAYVPEDDMSCLSCNDSMKRLDTEYTKAFVQPISNAQSSSGQSISTDHHDASLNIDPAMEHVTHNGVTFYGSSLETDQIAQIVT